MVITCFDHRLKKGTRIYYEGEERIITAIEEDSFECRICKWYDFALVAWWKLSDWFERRFK